MNNHLQKMLDDVTWNEFAIGDLFEIFTGANINKKEMSEGLIPRITATDNQNGVAMFTSELDVNNFRTYDNFISISFLGSVFYHKNKVSLDMKIHGIKPINFKLDDNSALFLLPLINRFTSKYSYGNQLSVSVLKRQKLILPTTQSGSPDWHFMTEIMQLINQKIAIEINFKPHDIHDIRELDDIEWGEFNLEEIFSIKSGIRLTKTNMKKGSMPFVGASDSNNGITNFTSNINQSLDSNVLGVNYNGSVVENFYHPYEAIFSDDVKRLSLKNIKGNKFLYLFLKTVILQQRDKYMYAYKFNGKRMERQKVILPIDDKGDIDYVFMEQYMKRTENELNGKVIPIKEKIIK